MSVRVEKSEYKLVRSLMRQGNKERVTFDNPDGSQWWIAIDEDTDTVLGCVCAVIKGNTARYKSDFVLPAFRGQGAYRELFKVRDEQISAEVITAFCTPLSLPMYLKNEFKAISINKNNITFVKREKR